MDERMNKNGENHPARKIAQSLRPVQASPDFEQRLHTRIASSVRPGESEKKSVLLPLRRPLPSFAYSLVAFAAVGVLAYYMYVRTGIVPEPSKPEVPVLQDGGSRPTENSPKSIVPQPIQQNSQSISKTNEDVNASRRVVPQHEITKSEQPRSTTTVLPDKRAITEKQDLQKEDAIQPQLQGAAAADNKDEHEEVMPSPIAAPKRMAVDQTKSTTGTLEFKPTYDSSSSFERHRILQPRFKDVLGIGVMSGAVASPMKDSVKLDSLKQLQRNVLQTKPKGKKPLD